MNYICNYVSLYNYVTMYIYIYTRQVELLEPIAAILSPYVLVYVHLKPRSFRCKPRTWAFWAVGIQPRHLPSHPTRGTSCLGADVCDKIRWLKKKKNVVLWSPAWNSDETVPSQLLATSKATIHIYTWGRGWMTKASGVGERRKGRGELRRDCHHRVAALFVPTRMQQWYMIYDI